MKITITINDVPGLPDGEYVIENPDNCSVEHDTVFFQDGREPVHRGPSRIEISGVLVSAPEGVPQ